MPNIQDSATTVYQLSEGDIHVQNDFRSEEKGSRLSFLDGVIAVAQNCQDSITVFRPDRSIAYYNDECGVYRAAGHAVSTLDHLCSLGPKTFKDYAKGTRNVLSVFRTRSPRYFSLAMLTGGRKDFACIPVLDGAILRGVILISRDGQTKHRRDTREETKAAEICDQEGEHIRWQCR